MAATSETKERGEAMSKYSFSTNEENYEGEYDTPEDAALECLTGEHEDFPKRCWTGRNVPAPAPESYFYIEDLIDHVSCQDCYIGDHADGWYFGTREQESEINEAVQKLIGEWLDRHSLRPMFYNVTEIQEWVLGDDGKPTRATEATQ